MQDIKEISMIVGHQFNSLIDRFDNIKEWEASKECATVASLVCHMVKVANMDVENATYGVVSFVTNNGFREVEDHAWDEYVRGFIAGQIIGFPTERNLKLLEKAEDLWDSDYKGKYGYFQEVCEEVLKLSVPGVIIV